MTETGCLRKMTVTPDSPAVYRLPVDDARLPMNPMLGHTVGLHWSGEIYCIHCGRKTNKSFSQGYCYPCFKSLARCDSCIVSPEKCHYDQGTCREPEWAESHCMRDHVVYLANSSGVKVGITRGSQVPTRWLDQGAVEALPVARVGTRYQAGLLEVVFKQHVNDRTNWRRMLSDHPPSEDLTAVRDALFADCADEIEALQSRFGLQAIMPLDDAPLERFEYPVLEYPTRVRSLNLEKEPDVQGRLMGIKGQYLMLDTGVINIRKYAGYAVTVTTE